MVALCLSMVTATGCRKLAEALAAGADTNGKDILVFDNGADMIDRDAGMHSDTIAPSAFAALDAAVTLAKISLLDQSAMRALIGDMGGHEASVAFDQGGYSVGQSLLIGSLRSIDGNDQWEPFGLPYPRQSGGGMPTDATARHFGYGPADGAKRGFFLFVDPVLRARVFAKLFARQIHGEIVTRPEMASGVYGFPICDHNPFPVTFDANGAATQSDDQCAGQPRGALTRTQSSH